MALPGDRALAGLAQWVGAGGLAAVQLLKAWGLGACWLLGGRAGGPLARWLGLAAGGGVAAWSGLAAASAQRAGGSGGSRLSVPVLQPDIPTKVQLIQQRALERRLREPRRKRRPKARTCWCCRRGSVSKAGAACIGAVEVLGGGFRQRGPSWQQRPAFSAGELEAEGRSTAPAGAPGRMGPRRLPVALGRLSAVGGASRGRPAVAATAVG